MKIYAIKKTIIVGGLWFAVLANAAQYEEGLALKAAGRLADAEAAFTEVLQQSPDDSKAVEQLAIVQSCQNKFEQSVASWRRLLQLKPDDVDARIGLARVLYWQGQRGEAQQLLRGVTQQQSNHGDAWILLGDVQMADGDAALARASYLQAQQLTGVADAALEKKIALAVPAKQWRLDAGVIADQYDKERGNENSAYLQLGYTTSGKTTWYGKFERFHYFSRTDLSLGAGVYWLPLDRLLLNAEWNKTTGDANFRPDTQLNVNVEMLFNQTIQPLLSYRDADYAIGLNQGSVITLTPGVRINFTAMSVELRQSRSENLDDSSTTVNSIKLSWDGEKYRPYLGYTSGDEATPPQPVADIRVISAGLVWTINSAWAARIDFANEDRKDTYKHNSLGIGFSRYF